MSDHRDTSLLVNHIWVTLMVSDIVEYYVVECGLLAVEYFYLDREVVEMLEHSLAQSLRELEPGGIFLCRNNQGVACLREGAENLVDMIYVTLSEMMMIRITYGCYLCFGLSNHVYNRLGIGYAC